jgi:GNAT superfamily N-acetyltransferase
MNRAQLFVRDARLEDAAALQAIWLDFAIEVKGHRQVTSLDSIARSILRLETEPSERLIVAVADHEVIGVGHLRRAPVSPIHEDDAVHVSYLHVLSGHRRRGAGKLLLEAAADWADAKDSPHVIASVAANAREANRFLARLGLGQVAVVRAVTVSTLRCKLGTAGKRSTNLIATRRLMRRSRELG